MLFTVLPNELKAAVSAIAPALGSKNSMPILDNIKLTPVDETHLALTASNGDFTIITRMEVMEPNDMKPALIPARNIREFIARALGVFPVQFSYADNGEWSLSDNLGEIKFVADGNVQEYPVLDVDLDNPVLEKTVPASVFIDAVNAAKGFVSNDDLRPVMCGVYLDFTDKGLFVVASDSKSLFRDVITDIKSDKPCSVIVPQKIVSSLKSLFAGAIGNDELTISFDAKNVCFKNGGTVIRGRIIEGRYPRYDMVIPKNNTAIAEVKSALMLAAVNRASISACSSTNQICLRFNGKSNLVVSAQDFDFSTSSTVNVETLSQKNLENFKIGVRANVFCACMNVFKSPNVLITFKEPSSAIVIRSDQSGRIALLMPMQLAE